MGLVLLVIFAMRPISVLHVSRIVRMASVMIHHILIVAKLVFPIALIVYQVSVFNVFRIAASAVLQVIENIVEAPAMQIVMVLAMG